MAKNSLKIGATVTKIVFNEQDISHSMAVINHETHILPLAITYSDPWVVGKNQNVWKGKADYNEIFQFSPLQLWNKSSTKVIVVSP